MSCCKRPKFHLHFRKMFLYKTSLMLCFIKYILCVSRSESLPRKLWDRQTSSGSKTLGLALFFLRFYLLKYLCNTSTSMCMHLTRIYYNQPLQSTDSGDLKFILNKFVLFALLHVNVVYFLSISALKKTKQVLKLICFIAASWNWQRRHTRSLTGR